MHLPTLILNRLEMPLRVQLDPVQVVIVQGQAPQRCIGGLRQPFQACRIETGQQRPPAAVHPCSALRIVQHAAVLAADGQH
ncbi:hypothetical protein D3C78_1861180 [compost metagenome]